VSEPFVRQRVISSRDVPYVFKDEFDESECVLYRINVA
jgi:hypothetical protein